MVFGKFLPGSKKDSSVVEKCIIYSKYYSQIPDWRNAVIVARNPGAAKRATSYSDRLRLGLAVIHGEQKETEEENIDGRHSPPPVVVRKATSAIEVLPCK